MGILNLLFGNVDKVAGAVTNVAGAFRPNAEANSIRSHERHSNAMAQYAAEFGNAKGRFAQFVDGLNRLPRPLMAFGTVGLFAYAMIDPIGFSERMAALDLVPQELWWLLGAIVSFYFGARELSKFRETKSAGHVVKNIQEIQRLKGALTPNEAIDDDPEIALDIAGDTLIQNNEAVEEWKKR